MATAPRPNTELEIIPLRKANFAALESLFDEQCEEWLELLRWEYSEPSRLIRQVARDRELAGFVATSGGETVGFSYYVVESGRGSIGDVYVSRNWRGLGIDRQMTAAVLEELDHSRAARRIESQCVSIGNDASIALLEARGFERFDRHYMTMELASTDRRSKATQDVESASRISIRPWEDEDFTRAAEVIQRSYRGQHDSRINTQYRTEAGCAELLSILTDHIWCGEFLSGVSRVAFQSATGRLVGVLIGSRIAPGAGHIGQISVNPAYQGRGLGRRMISSALREYTRRGFDSVSLAVTSANASALHLYESCGFRSIHTFPVFFREKR
ncbi:MAG TPA: GNAT family N-acetyltransferase [Blastocatellia bacterium]|nr:GNAT family N-acetyltransferase [Blastocatellia bacterium]